MTRTRRGTIGAAAVIPALLIGVLGGTHPGAPSDSGLAACTYPLSTHDIPAAEYPKIRARFAASRSTDGEWRIGQNCYGINPPENRSMTWHCSWTFTRI